MGYFIVSLESQFAYNSSKAALQHLGKMMATEFALKNVRVRVNDIAPGMRSYLPIDITLTPYPAGVYASEMTGRQGGHFTPEEADKVGKPLRPLPAGRDGS